MIRLAFLLTCATALQCELAVSLDDLDFVSTFPVEAAREHTFTILVRKIGRDRDSSHGPSRRHPGLRLYTSREPQGRAPYYTVH